MLAGEYLFVRDHAQSVHGSALYRGNVGFNLSDGGEAERVTGAYLSANLVSTLGVSAVLGRGFREAEEQAGESGVVVLSHAMWRQRFGGDASIIGRDVLIDSEPRRVVGVMPSTFNFPSASTQLWIPYTFDRGNAAALWGPPRGRDVSRCNRTRQRHPHDRSAAVELGRQVAVHDASACHVRHRGAHARGESVSTVSSRTR